MFYTACTLKQLRNAVNSLIVAVGEDAPVGVAQDKVIGDYCMLTWVIIDKDGNIVGSEADDDTPNLKDGQRNAIQIK